MSQAPTQITIETIDCVSGMKLMEAESVDLVVTSPPYNLGIKYKQYKDAGARDQYLEWSKLWAEEVKRVLKPAGSFFLNLGACPSNPLLPHQLVVELCEGQFVLQNTFHWIKSISIEKKAGVIVSAGHFKPIPSKRFVNDCHEYLFHLTKDGKTELDRLAVGVPYSDKSNIARWAHTKGKDARCRGNNWFVPYKTIVSRDKQRPHPATFPVELAVNCIKIHGIKPGMLMMDPFLGIGHAALAAQQCGVSRFIGFEIDPHYAGLARKSLTEPHADQIVLLDEKKGETKSPTGRALKKAAIQLSLTSEE
jgi:site-specific DNA-methyltransferase (adenine-specific)